MNIHDTKMQLHKYCIYHALCCSFFINIYFICGNAKRNVQKKSLQQNQYIWLSVGANQEFFRLETGIIMKNLLIKQLISNLNNIPVLLIVNGGIENATVLNESIILSLFLLPTKIPRCFQLFVFPDNSLFFSLRKMNRMLCLLQIFCSCI